MNNRIKILIIGPQGSGKTTFANILGGLQEGLSENTRPTVGCRIVDFERDAPPQVGNFGKVNIELWDVSGDLKYEKCWAPIQQDVQGIIFVYDTSNPSSEDQLKVFVENFPKALKLKMAWCMCFLNSHSPDGVNAVPGVLEKLEHLQCQPDDTQGIYS